MTIQRMDNVGIVVDDLPATIAFFRELEGQAVVEGEWAERGEADHELTAGREQPGHVGYVELRVFDMLERVLGENLVEAPSPISSAAPTWRNSTRSVNCG